MVDIHERMFAPLPTDSPSDWAVKNIVFADQEVNGPLNLEGRQYLRAWIDDAEDTDFREKTYICATSVGKTLAIMSRHVYIIVHHPRRGLMVMPATKGEGGSETYVNSRFIPCLEATKATRDLMPDGQRRLFMNSKKVRINGCHFGFVGANSPAQVASNRCSIIDMDEIDKFKGRLGNEAGTKQLVGERTEGVKDYIISQSTTPTIESGQGWQCLLRSDFRLRFLPCPHCNSEYRNRELLEAHSVSESNLKGWMTLAWNDQFCVLPDRFSFSEGRAPQVPLMIPRAHVVWDAEAKRKDGSWDKNRIVNSVRLECPHCKGHIRDEQKIWMDANGVWIPTRDSMGHKGYHLSALYAPPLVSREQDPIHKSLLAGRALKFLDAQEEGLMKNIINSMLAEVDVAQEHGRGRIEMNSVPLAQPDWVPLLTADFQKLWPHIWFVVRNWCAFRLLPPFPIVDGLPSFVNQLDRPENAKAREICLKLGGTGVPPVVSGVSRDTGKGEVRRGTGQARGAVPPAAWLVIAEINRLASGTQTISPLIEFLIAQNIVGEKLVNFYTETAGPTRDTLAFRKAIYREMSLHTFGKPDAIRAPRGGDSELIAAGYCELSGEAVWEELKDIAKEFAVGKGMPTPGRCVTVDCGYAEKFNREVLRKCYETGSVFHWFNPITKLVSPRKMHNFCLPVPIDGWFPSRGKPTNRPLGMGKINHELFLNTEDPFYGTPQAGAAMVQVLELPSGLFWMHKDNLRQKRTKNTYGISPKVEWYPKTYLPDGTRTAESKFKPGDYEKQLNEQYYDEKKGKVEPRHGRGGAQSKAHPYHLDDCEVYQVALATHHEFFER